MDWDNKVERVDKQHISAFDSFSKDDDAEPHFSIRQQRNCLVFQQHLKASWGSDENNFWQLHLSLRAREVHWLDYFLHWPTFPIRYWAGPNHQLHQFTSPCQKDSWIQDENPAQNIALDQCQISVNQRNLLRNWRICDKKARPQGYQKRFARTAEGQSHATELITSQYTVLKLENPVCGLHLKLQRRDRLVSPDIDSSSKQIPDNLLRRRWTVFQQPPCQAQQLHFVHEGSKNQTVVKVYKLSEQNYEDFPDPESWHLQSSRATIFEEHLLCYVQQTQLDFWPM